MIFYEKTVIFQQTFLRLLYSGVNRTVSVFWRQEVF